MDMNGFIRETILLVAIFALYLLFTYQTKIFSVEELYEYLYPQSSEVQYRSITEYIYQIRQKLKPYGIDPIKTLWGGGYKWQNQ